MLKLFKTFARRLRPLSRSERELAYLNAAANLYDLEQRQGQIERGRFRDDTFGAHFA